MCRKNAGIREAAVSMDAVIYTTDGQEYELLSGILEEESPGLTGGAKADQGRGCCRLAENTCENFGLSGWMYQ